MKYILILLLSVAWLCHVQAQDNYNKSFATQGAKQLIVDMKYPELIRISTHNGNEILVTGSVSINNGESNQAFELIATLQNGVITLQEKTENYNGLPKRMMIKKGDTKFYFPTDNWNDPAVQKFFEDNGHDGGYYSTNGVLKEITLDIKVPQSMAMDLRTDYGIFEVLDFKQSITAFSKYGEVDISIAESGKYNLSAKVKHGEIFTNLNVKFEPLTTSDKKLAKWNDLYCQMNGGGVEVKAESTYGSVYLRKK